jgi:hypothetical protein
MLLVDRVRRKVIINIMLFVFAVIMTCVPEVKMGTYDLQTPIAAGIIYIFFNLVILRQATIADMTDDKFRTNFIALQHFLMLAILMAIVSIVTVVQSQDMLYIMSDENIDKIANYLLITIAVTYFFRVRKDIWRLIMGFK